jgi:hypothetical protein
MLNGKPAKIPNEMLQLDVGNDGKDRRFELKNEAGTTYVFVAYRDTQSVEDGIGGYGEILYRHQSGPKSPQKDEFKKG